MKLPLSFSVTAALLFLIAIACNRETLDTSPEPTPPEASVPDKMVTSTFQGKVLDENGSPVNEAIVKAGGTVTHTNEYGIFRFDNITTSQQFAYLKVEKPGYFPGSRTAVASEGGFSFVEVKLLPLQSRGHFESASEAKIDISSEASVSFTSNSVRLANGSAYSGNVNVLAVAIDPTAPDFSSTMPGALRGVRADNNVSAMTSYGMLGITLTGDGGEALQLDSSQPARIMMDIPASLRASAPKEIALWYFDESDGKWKEEGVATKNGNSYSGLVKHFSYWNFVVPHDLVFVDLKLQTDAGDPVSYNPVKIIDTRYDSYNMLVTDSTGYLRTSVPKNAPLKIQVLNGCGEISLSHNAGSFSEDAGIGTLTVPSEEMALITGRVVDCEANPITEGYANALVRGLYYRGTINEGVFSIYVNKCISLSFPARVYAVEAGTSASSESDTVMLDGPSISTRDLVICTEKVPQDQYIRFRIDGTEYELATPSDEFQYMDYPNSKIRITGTNNSEDPTNKLTFQLESSDTLIESSKTLFLIKADGGTHFSTHNAVEVTVSSFGQINEFIELSFNGPLQRLSGIDSSIVTFSGSLRVLRKKTE